MHQLTKVRMYSGCNQRLELIKGGINHLHDSEQEHASVYYHVTLNNEHSLTTAPMSG
jgi:hypothetical protein